MRVSLRDLDFWMAKGFGGILNMLHTRVTQFRQGFDKKTCALFEIETRRMNELNDAVQASPEGTGNEITDMATLDNWFILAFAGLDKHLGTRSAEGPSPFSAENLLNLEEHAKRLLYIVDKERRKCQPSPGI